MQWIGLIILCILGFSCASGWNPSLGYKFPLRWQATTLGYAQDAYVKHQKAITSGFMYTDYTLNKTRVDEVWNQTSIAGTPLAKNFGSDTHLFTNDGAYIWYFNEKGATCSITKSMKGPTPPQSLFDSASAYVGPTEFYGKNAYLYNVTQGLPWSLWVSQETGNPLAFYIGAAPFFWDGSLVVLYTFSEVQQPFTQSKILFSLPSFCSNITESP